MVEWLQIYIPTSVFLSPYLSSYLSPYLSTTQHLVTRLLNNQLLLWSAVVLFIIFLRWITHPRRHVW